MIQIHSTCRTGVTAEIVKPPQPDKQLRRQPPHPRGGGHSARPRRQQAGQGAQHPAQPQEAGPLGQPDGGSDLPRAPAQPRAPGGRRNGQPREG